MRFWVMTIGGALITLLGGLLPLSKYQTYIRHFFQEMTDNHIQRMRAALVVLGVAMMVVNAFLSDATIKKLGERIELIARPSLTEEQKSLFVKTLKERPKGEVDIQCGVEATWAFCRQLALLFEIAGWNFNVHKVEFNAPPQGIIIVTKSVENPSAKAIQEAFELAGSPLTFFGNAPPQAVLNAAVLSPPGNEIWLIIGDKP